MLTCALIVWLLHPVNWEDSSLRETFLTSSECQKHQVSNKNFCIKIDKRKNLTKLEWEKDNCSLSEHEWIGDKIEVENFIK